MKRSLTFLMALIAPVFLSAATPSSTATTQSSTKTKTYVVNVTGMTCGSCAEKVEASLMKLNGVQGVSVDHKSGKTVVMVKETSQISLEQVKAAIKEAGYEVQG